MLDMISPEASQRTQPHSVPSTLNPRRAVGTAGRWSGGAYRLLEDLLSSAKELELTLQNMGIGIRVVGINMDFQQRTWFPQQCCLNSLTNIRALARLGLRKMWKVIKMRTCLGVSYILGAIL